MQLESIVYVSWIIHMSLWCNLLTSLRTEINYTNVNMKHMRLSFNCFATYSPWIDWNPPAIHKLPFSVFYNQRPRGVSWIFNIFDFPFEGSEIALCPALWACNFSRSFSKTVRFPTIPWAPSRADLKLKSLHMCNTSRCRMRRDFKWTLFLPSKSWFKWLHESLRGGSLTATPWEDIVLKWDITALN